ncbi:hypothetical protein LZ31DRAFT_291973 [Colletotrichum somersetense]|nr:hypothetical protein LZ31DRAFT_291973 [Colletotrichum somersetense]
MIDWLVHISAQLSDMRRTLVYRFNFQNISPAQAATGVHVCEPNVIIIVSLLARTTWFLGNSCRQYGYIRSRYASTLVGEGGCAAQPQRRVRSRGFHGCERHPGSFSSCTNTSFLPFSHARSLRHVEAMGPWNERFTGQVFVQVVGIHSTEQ